MTSSVPTGSAGRPGSSDIEKVATGVRGLDTILHGGLPAGRTTLLAGGPGTGKTALAVEVLARGAARGAGGVLVSFEEPPDHLRANARTVGLDIEGQEQAGRLRVVHAEVPYGAVRTGAYDIHGLLAMLDGHLRAVKGRTLVLDALDVLMRLFGDADREREELHILHRWLRERGLTAILTAKEDRRGVRMYPFLDYLADCVVLLDQRMKRQVRTRRLSVVKYRGSGFLSNEHPYALTSRGVVLLPVSSMSMERPAPRERITSGVAGLDELLGGGLFRGSTVLIAGPSGAGKTTLAGSFVQAACRGGERALFLAYEESASAMRSQLGAVGVALGGEMDEGRLRVQAVLPEAVGVEEHLVETIDQVDRFTPDHVVVDAITACRRMGSTESVFDLFIRLLTICKERGTTCLLTDQLRSGEGVFPGNDIEAQSLMDTMISLELVPSAGGLTRRVTVVKSHGAWHSLRTCALSIGPEGMCVGEPLDGQGESMDGGRR